MNPPFLWNFSEISYQFSQPSFPSCGSCWSGGLGGSGWPSWANFWYFLPFWSDLKVFWNGYIGYDDPKEFHDPQVSDCKSSFQMNVWTLKIQRNSWSPGIWWFKGNFNGKYGFWYSKSLRRYLYLRWSFEISVDDFSKAKFSYLDNKGLRACISGMMCSVH